MKYVVIIISTKHTNAAHMNPAPIAIPIAAVTQSPAAVVRPLTCRLSVTIIVPAPRNPIPHKSCAGILPMSAGYADISDRYSPVIVASADPMHTSAKVLIPAAYLLLALSTPTRLPRSIASKSRKAMENAFISLKKYRMSFINITFSF